MEDSIKEYLLFDLDGTLTDPKVGICTSFQYALSAFGIEEPDIDKLTPVIGPPLVDSFRDFYGFDEEKAKAAVEKYRERFSTIGKYENEVYPGVHQLLRTLRDAGFKLAVASSKPQVFVEDILQHFKLDKYFDVVVGSELDGTRGTKDQVVAEALKQLFKGGEIKFDSVYMIGDRKFDVEGAHALGIESVAVTYGYGDMEELKTAKSDYIVTSVNELRKFLMRDAERLAEKANPEKTVKQQNGFRMRNLWEILYSFLIFLFVKNLVSSLLYFILYQLVMQGSEELAEALVFYDQEAQIMDFSGNIQAFVAGISFIAAGWAVLSRAKTYIAKHEEDTHLEHLVAPGKLSYVFMGTLCLGLLIFGNLLSSLSGAMEASESYQAVSDSQYAASLIVGLIIYGIVAPVCEELCFRGIVYTYIRRFFDWRLAMIASGFLFGFYHGNSVQGMYAGMMGMVLAFGYEYFGSFKAPVIMHAGINIITFIMTKYLPAQSGFYSWPICAAGLVIALGSIVGLKLIRKNS